MKNKRTWLVIKRLQKGLSQTELAEEVGVTNGTISNFENGIRTPSGETAYKISEILDFDMKLFYE